ncbi:MAG TPA: deoxyribonuclease V [Nitrospiraceae bacterium]|jgi:deoxyribonuclease V|nr:deoxyribonuclease V [Nitrospiraceae bacterium]
MQVKLLHAWDITPREAVQLQLQLRGQVKTTGRVPTPASVAGADVAYDKQSDRLYVAVVVLSFPSLEPMETVILRDRVSFPYIPGLLSFREAPALLRAFERLVHEPDIIFIDGQGVAHPRGLGLACHIGLSLEKPVIGCAKSLLFGSYIEPKPARSSVSYLRDKAGRIIGAAVRTRDRVRPVFVSVGHNIGLGQAVRLTLACGKGYRVPEPTRQADLLAERAKRRPQRDELSIR